MVFPDPAIAGLQSDLSDFMIQGQKTYDYPISKATEWPRNAIRGIALLGETKILYVPASSSELLHDLCEDHEILTIEQSQHDPNLLVPQSAFIF